MLGKSPELEQQRSCDNFLKISRLLLLCTLVTLRLHLSSPSKAQKGPSHHYLPQSIENALRMVRLVKTCLCSKLLCKRLLSCNLAGTEMSASKGYFVHNISGQVVVVV